MSGPVVVPAFPKGAEQAVGAGGYGRHRRPGWAIVNERSFYLPYCEAVMAEIQARMRSIQSNPTFSISLNNDKIRSNNDLKKSPYTIKDGTEDANHNGKIDGDNGDGVWSDSEVWTELNPNDDDTDGDTFSDNDEKDWGYNPLSKDTDSDGIEDNIEDSNSNGQRDGSETSALLYDTDKDGLSDSFEKSGWTILIIYEATLEEKSNYDVSCDPLDTDSDDDGISDLKEFENGTDPNKADTDGDGFTDKYEIDHDIGSSPTGIDGKPPTITDFKAGYELEIHREGLKLVSEYKVNIYVSAADVFGLEWMNVHLQDCGDKKVVTGDVTSINSAHFEFTLSVEKAVSSLFNSFGVNITAADQNENIGYKAEEVKSISEIIIERFIDDLININSVFDIGLNILEKNINEIIFDLITNNIGYFEISILLDSGHLTHMIFLSEYIENRVNSLISPVIGNIPDVRIYYENLILFNIFYLFRETFNIDINDFKGFSFLTSLITGILESTIVSLQIIINRIDIVDISEHIVGLIKELKDFINNIVDRRINKFITFIRALRDYTKVIIPKIENILFVILKYIGIDLDMPIDENLEYILIDNPIAKFYFNEIWFTWSCLTLIFDLINAVIGLTTGIGTVVGILVSSLDFIAMYYFWPDWLSFVGLADFGNFDNSGLHLEYLICGIAIPIISLVANIIMGICECPAGIVMAIAIGLSVMTDYVGIVYFGIPYYLNNIGVEIGQEIGPLVQPYISLLHKMIYDIPHVIDYIGDLTEGLYRIYVRMRDNRPYIRWDPSFTTV